MAEIVANCPRCGAKHITFDVLASQVVRKEYDWQLWYEVFSICRRCHVSTILLVCDAMGANHDFVHEKGLLKINGAINDFVDIRGYISLKNEHAIAPPEHLPPEIQAFFSEGATCLAVGCFNAAGTMFRLCLDAATRNMLPEEEHNGLNHRVRRDLGLRLPWLFDNGFLPEALRELSACIKDDGNDGAHAGTLTRVDAEDLLDFCLTLLERLYTEPAKLAEAKARRDARRAK
ncbi:DUF4145 domain-containing protein [Herbaspirillum sp. C7C8]|uniref:DUF4145 domain-containing protein n=1 Tax=Herbaspirillum sp. C7C8 TaxID=2736665 RepID=UPI001F52923D|nr:DUF4145 domain-containing protein [Herbaspirillum sp. C7C8]MCI1004287.1 DUF4145 domain-containing protein [Herbaspirillum sp. C7C8]